MGWTFLELAAGIALAAMTLRDVFDTVVVPGSSRTTLHVARRLVLVLLPVWKRLRGRRRGLSTMFAPVALVAAFAIWMGLLAIAFGLMSHASHPSLIYFRSTGTGSGWPAALGALLDLALIIERCLDMPDLRGLAILLREDASHMCRELSGLIALDPDPAPPDAGDAAAMAVRLAGAGYRRQNGFDPAAFAHEREGHSEWVRALAHHLGRPEAGLLPHD